MANEKNSFILYYEDIDWFTEYLTYTEAGKLIASLFKYEVYGEVPQDLPQIADIGFRTLKKKLDQNKEKWQKISDSRSSAGRKGGLVTQDQNRQAKQIEANESKAKQTEANQAVTVTVTDTATETVTDTGFNKGKTTKQKAFSPPTLSEVQHFIRESGITNVDAERFVDYYTANGWMVGRNKMKDWKASVRYWSRNNFQGNTGQSKPISTADRLQDMMKRGVFDE